MQPMIEKRKPQVLVTQADTHGSIVCEKPSVAGSVSQRACVFCGSRVVLYPIADAVHLVHGPIGCAAYTWDIRGSLSSGPQLHRNSFCTNLGEQDIIRGGEAKLYATLVALIDRYAPAAAFVYATCVVGVIGDDLEAVCKRVAAEKHIPVIPVGSEGFKGSKKDGYRAACDALMRIVGTREIAGSVPNSINIVGDFNVANETRLVRSYFERIGITVIATVTGDSRIDTIAGAHAARLNIVQCSGSMTHLAQSMQERFGIPYERVSFFGIDDIADALYRVADHFGDRAICEKTRELVRSEVGRVMPELARLRTSLAGKRAALNVGGAFKAISLVKALRHLGMKCVLAGTQTGNKADYERLASVCDPDTVIVDDSNPIELAGFIRDLGVDLFIGGVKERPVAYKLGVGFCDHNHERKFGLAGFEGMVRFANEVHRTVTSPVWKLIKEDRYGDQIPHPHTESLEQLL